MEKELARPKYIWKNIIFFAVTTLTGVIGAPLYILHNGFPLPAAILFAVYMVGTGMAITVGYHRCYSHSTFKAHPVIEVILLFFGAAAFEQSAYDWSSQHRDHHRFVDTDKDPYSIKKGFWYAHIGWLLFWEHPPCYDNVRDLEKNKLVMHQYNNYLLWAVGSGIVAPVLIGALTGHALAAFIFSVCLRLTFVYHSTFFINSLCHMVGTATYDIYATAKDHWVIALLTNGEGYHNFHHRFPGDFRNGVRWYHWDPSKWLIMALAAVGLAKDLKRVSSFKIIHARLAAQHKLAGDQLVKLQGGAQFEKGLEILKGKYENLLTVLHHWEGAFSDYRVALRSSLTKKSREIMQASEKLKEAKANFRNVHQEWRSIVRYDAHAQLSRLGLSASRA